MKNLKKVLSLVLTLAMALSLMTVAFAKDASDYNDYDEVTYKEAVDVMTAAGIFDGMGANNFQPDGTLTREQAAKIITYMLMGKSNADKLTTTIAPYGDVSADRWSAGAIAYCTNEGIISGMGHNKFAPSDPVTGLQFAKMLLVALGYDAEIENLVGDSWAINTSKLAISVGLDDNMEEVSLSQPLTREQATLMAFNAMQSPLVEYPSKGTTIEVNGATVSFGAQQAQYVTTTRANEQTISSETLSNSKEYTIEFAEQYCRDLTLRGDRDAFERPAHTWRYDNELIGTYQNTPDLTYTTAVENGTIYADLGLTKSAKATEQYVDGRPAAASALQTMIRRDDETINGTGNGVLTQVWFEKDDQGEVVELIITSVNTYVATVNAVQNANKENRSITLNLYNRIPGTLDNKYETQSFAADDLVTYTAAWNGTRYEIQSVEALTGAATGTLTAWNGDTANTTTGFSENNFTVAGTTYNYSDNYAIINEDGAEIEISGFEVDESELNVYVDQYGYAIYVSGVEAEKNYAVVIGVGSTNPYGSETTGVTLMLPDGTKKEATAKLATDSAKLTDSTGTVGGATAQTVNDAVGDIVTYKIGDDGVYELTVAGATFDSKITGHYNGTGYNGVNEVQFLNGRSLFVLDRTADNDKDRTLFATEDTVFVVATEKIGGGYNYEVYVGYENMPSIDTAVPTTGIAYVTNSEYSSQLDIVYIATERLAGVSGVDTYFVKEKNEQIFTDNTDSYYRLPAIVNGEKTEIKVDATKTYKNASGAAAIDFTDNDDVYGLFAITDVITDKNGIITDFRDVTTAVGGSGSVFDASTGTNNKTSGTVGTVRVASGVLGIGANGDKDLAEYYAYDSNTVAYYVDKDYKDINVINISSIANDTNDYVYGIRDDDVPTSYKKLSEVVIVEREDSTTTNYTVSINGIAGKVWAQTEAGQNVSGGVFTVEEGKDLKFKLSPLPNYSVASVKVGNTVLTPDANGVYTVSNVTGNTVVDVAVTNVITLTLKGSANSEAYVSINGGAYQALTTSGTPLTVNEGATVTMTVMAVSGKTINNVTAAGNLISNVNNTYTIVAVANGDVVVTTA